MALRDTGILVVAGSKLRVLILADYYSPGYKWGGSIRSLLNLIDALGDKWDFRVVTSDHDLGNTQPYPDVTTNVWQQVGKAQVFYMSRNRNSVWLVRDLICQTPHDVLYLNSFFSPRFSIVPMLLMRFGMIAENNVIVAPRGEFSAGALAVKEWKKRLYISASRILGTYKRVAWHVSNEHEGRDVREIFGTAKLRMAGDLTTVRAGVAKKEGRMAGYAKTRGVLNAVFLSRISPKKNLAGALQMLQELRGQVNLTIFGPLEDTRYWEKCRSIADLLPANVRVKYGGIIAHDKVIEVLEQYDLFVFPTRGENFGHVIIEALIAGCPILISDQTPWRNLEAIGVGWDLPLGTPERFVEVLQNCIDMGSEELEVMRRNAMAYGREKAADEEVLQQNRSLFGCLPKASR
jgi:glycosyltransferase involved in cell wall biosynthesis